MYKKQLASISSVSINHSGKVLVGIIILTLILGYRATSLRLYLSYDYLLPEHNSQIVIFNQILDTFENDTKILLLATGSEDSLRSFAYRIKPLLESFDGWVSSVYTQPPIKFLRKNILKLMKQDELESLGEQ